MTRRSFGKVDRLPSGMYRARYIGPDGARHSAKTAAGRPLTFSTLGDAEAYLAKIRTDISREVWKPVGPQTEPAVMTLCAYANAWLTTRPLAIRTRKEYRGLLDRHIFPAFGDTALVDITPAAIRDWHARDAGPTVKAHSYALLKSILATAVEDEVFPANPCRIRGAGRAKTVKKIRPATLGELAALTAALPEQYRMLAQLATWCSLRFGELAGLRRGDIETKHGVLHVRRSVAFVAGHGLVVKEPKSAAGIRTVTIPPHILDDLDDHLRRFAEPTPGGYVFPAARGGPLSASSFAWVFRVAAAQAGRPDLTPHGLRHTGQTYAAVNGANLRELMQRAGQSTPSAALRYLHEVDGRQQEIAERLAEHATGKSKVTPIAGRRKQTEG